jgi:hypothetical protein
MKSRADIVRDEIMIHRASGDALNRISKFYGFERPLFIKDQYWAEALRNAVYSARGTLGVFTAFLEALFKEYIEFAEYTFEVVTPTVLRYNGAGLDLCNLDSRYVNINGKRHFITHHNGTLVYLSPTSTTYWGGASLSNIGANVDVQVLPYLIEEHGGEVKLIIDAGLFVIPPTYLRQDAEARQNEPYGGHIMDFFSNDPAERFNSPEAGANPASPAYLLLDIFFERFFTVIRSLLAASIKLTVVNKKWCENAQSIYASLTTVLKFGSVDPNVTPTQPART